MKRIVSYGTIGAIGFSSGYILTSETRRRKAKRALLFWSKALPVYMRYRWEEYKTKDWSEEDKDKAFDRLHKIYAPRCLDDILELRGLYIKLGQIMTTRADYAPPAYINEFMKLQDAVPARPFSQIASLVKSELQIDDLSDVFESIEEEPLGAATIAQVHGAVLKNGDQVVIKVQYEEVEQLFMEDLKTVKDFCKLLQPEYVPMLDEMERQFLTEFNFEREGWALETIGNGINKKFRGVHIPIPYRQYCTKRVCVMERLNGVKLVDGLLSYYKKLADSRGVNFDDLMLEQKREGEKNVASNISSNQMRMFRFYILAKSALYNSLALLWNCVFGLLSSRLRMNYMEANLPVNHIELIHTLLDVHGYEIFDMGIFNGDCHPGNIFLMPDESIGLIDYGQVKELTLEDRARIARVVLALCGNDSSEIVKQFKEMGFQTENDDDWVTERTARFFFEDDTDEGLLRRKDGSLMNLQQVMEYLNKEDKTVEFPEYAFMVIRTAMLLRGLASHLNVGVNVAKAWEAHASRALEKYEKQ